MIRKKAMAFLNGKMAGNIGEIGRMGSNMD